jgi:hypothetical protein
MAATPKKEDKRATTVNGFDDSDSNASRMFEVSPSKDGLLSNLTCHALIPTCNAHMHAIIYMLIGQLWSKLITSFRCYQRTSGGTLN